MKFQIIPDQNGQIARSCEEDDGIEYIITSISQNGTSTVECVKLGDLQRNLQHPENVTKHQMEPASLTVVADNLEKYVASWNIPVKKPHSLKAYFVENLEDVKQYFRDIHAIYECEFHPDDSFENYTDEQDRPTFSSDEAVYLDFVMNQCFDVCDANDADIYEVAGEVQIETWKRRGMWPMG